MRIWLAAAALAAGCATGGPRTGSLPKQAEGSIEVDDALHGVKYVLPAADEGWQIAREGKTSKP